MAEQRELRPLPPYFSYATFVTLLDWFKEMTVVPHEWDRSLWSGKFSGGVGAQIASGLRFLQLLKDNKITPELEQLALADSEGRKQQMRGVLANAYGNDFLRDLARMTPKNLEDRLRNLGATDSTVRKAESFFINAAKVSGVQVPANIAKKARIRVSGSRRTNGRGSQRDDGREDPSGGRVERSRSEDDGSADDAILEGLPPLIAALMMDLKKKGPLWTREQRDKWVSLFESNLDYVYPVTEVTANDG